MSFSSPPFRVFLVQHRNVLNQMVWQRYFLTDLLTFFVVTFKVGTNMLLHATVYLQQAETRTICPPAQGQAILFIALCNVQCNCIAGLF